MSKKNEQFIKEKTVIHSLKESADKLQRSSDHYLAYAARNYESYYRDIDVYYKALQQDLSLISDDIIKLSTLDELSNEHASRLFSFINTQKFIELASNIDSLRIFWIDYTKKLDNKLGSKSEPRLEWGATFISENTPLLILELESLISSFNQITRLQSSVAHLAGRLIILSTIIFSGIFAIWFYFHIVKPITSTQKAFYKVANGDFGHQIKTQRLDEIGLLTHSFNQMTSRSELVLSILNSLQNIESSESLLEKIYDSTKHSMKTDVMMFVERNKKATLLNMSQLFPNGSFKSLNKLSVKTGIGNQRDLFLNDINNGKIINVDNVPDFTDKNIDALLLKSVTERYPFQSALLVPLNESSYQGVLVFASFYPANFTHAHVELFTHLKSLLKKRILEVKSLT
ncbi:methyl-accepting chemotaxis protein [Pleionea sediminis]|uniref:methyl-accepting chemotaxis protein n=1 Tax=Pleionea sediminis TaxID=2569479 RepID=UPI0013DDBD11|nr:HAMP domain-containing protein [Pleionea sediminis]